MAHVVIATSDYAMLNWLAKGVLRMMQWSTLCPDQILARIVVACDMQPMILLLMRRDWKELHLAPSDWGFLRGRGSAVL